MNLKLYTRGIVAAAATAASVPALAAAPVLTDLTAAVDVTTIIAAILAVGIFGVGIRLTWVAVGYVMKQTQRS